MAWFHETGRGKKLPTQPLTGSWYRAVQPKHFATALAYGHTATIPGRFNSGSVGSPGIQVLYFGEDQVTCLYEVAAILGSPLPNQPSLPNPANPWTVVPVAVQLTQVVDLTNQTALRALGTSEQELTGDWRCYALRPNAAAMKHVGFPVLAPTQELGDALHAWANVEGFITYSAKVPVKRNLVVFPQRIQAGNFVRFTDPATGMTYSIP